MIHFDDLRFSRDGKYLIIDTAIDSQDFYTNVFLDRIIIDNQDTFVNNGPSSNPIYTYEVTNSMKQIKLEIQLSLYDINPYKDMLFVYVIASGTPSADTPCGLDNDKIMGTVVNLKGIYDNMLYYIKQIENDCEIPKNFIDSILKYKAFELSIRTDNYPLAIKYWKKYLSNINPSMPTTKTCNCHG